MDTNSKPFYMRSAFWLTFVIALPGVVQQLIDVLHQSAGAVSIPSGDALSIKVAAASVAIYTTFDLIRKGLVALSTKRVVVSAPVAGVVDSTTPTDQGQAL